MIPTTGRWSLDERGVYFIATAANGMREASIRHGYLWHLVAINDLCSMAGDGRMFDRARVELEAALDRGARIMLDSGVFWLTNQHKRRHSMTMDAALSLPPDRIDGFDILFRAYVNVASEYGHRMWGIIELDQGGAENKRRTRAKLQDLGINPLPVYHPLNDGWEYFDELAEQTDRMCTGNVVQASMPVRTRIVNTIAERHRAYPQLWNHFLGYTPCPTNFAVPIDSCDSSSWCNLIRWGHGKQERAGGLGFEFVPEFIATHGEVAALYHEQMLILSSQTAMASMRNWRQHREALHEQGLDLDYQWPEYAVNRGGQDA